MTPETVLKGFPLYRHYYLRVSGEAQNRLTISTFLGGLTFASFAALLTARPISSFTIGTGIASAIDVMLGAATFLFLLTAASTYAALQRLADLSPAALKALGDDPPPAGAPDPPIDVNDALRLADAYHAYEEPRHFIPAGLALLFASLVLVGFQVNVLVGALVALIFVALLLSVRTMLRMMFASVQETSTTWLRSRRKASR